MSTSIEFEHSIGNSIVPDGLCYHPNGENYVYCAGSSVVIGHLSNPQSQEFLRGHDGRVTCIALSPSGRYLASGQEGDNSDIFVWDFATRKKVFSFEEHDFKVERVAFSDDERLLASIGSSDDGNLFFWDLSNGAIVASAAHIPKDTKCIAHGGFVRDIKRRDTQRYLMCSGGAQGLVLWDLDPYSGDLVSTKIVGDARATISRDITAMVFSYDREYLFAATFSGDFLVVSMKSQKIVRAVPATRMGLCSIYALRDAIVIGGGDGSLIVFDPLDLTEMRRVNPDGTAVRAISPSPDRLEVITLTEAGSVIRVNLSNMHMITISESHTGGCTAVAFNPLSSERIATVSIEDKTIRVWDLVDYMLICTGRGRQHRSDAYPLCLVFGDYVISGWSDGSVIAHNPEDGAVQWHINDAHASAVTSIAMSHNGRFFITGAETGEIRMWEMRTRELVSSLKEHKQRVTSLALFSDDTIAVSASKDRCILRWDLRQERRMFCHTQRMGAINAATLSRDETHILSVGQEKRLTYWGISELNPLHAVPLDSGNDEGKCIAVSSNGELIATGGSIGVLRIWDFASGALVSEHVAHAGSVQGVAFSPDDKQVVSVGSDGCINIWCIYND